MKWRLLVSGVEDSWVIGIPSRRKDKY